PIVGANQTSQKYWERITTYFNENKKTEYDRSSDALNHRWRTIAADISYFCPLKAKLDWKNESGKTEHDRINGACEMYASNRRKDFPFMRCWQLRRGTRKWQDWVAVHAAKRSSKRASNEMTQSADDISDSESPQEIPRPIGRDAAKKRHGSAAPTSSDSGALSLFERIAHNRELKHQREIEWAVDNKAVNERQLESQQQKVNNQCEQMRIQQEQMRIQREQWDWTRFQDENKIMLMDLNSCSEKAKEYFLSS
ncbi:hypothetical protein BS78_05G080000, partial [Paspalum vaginatum]